MAHVLTVIGARPQFVKAAAVSLSLTQLKESGGRSFQEIIIHTGQHYDYEMSQVFFDELHLPKPDYQLNVGSATHGAQTAAMMKGIEEICLSEKPSGMLVYGDTNSTLAGALVGAKLHIPIIHVEAGLRSYDRRMPEEINRIVTDTLSSLLFCPSELSRANLMKEGITAQSHVVGDVMLDSVNLILGSLKDSSERHLEQNGVLPGKYVLATIHRAENTDDPVRLRRIIESLAAIAEKVPVLFPIHPRTAKLLKELGLSAGKVIIRSPLGYIEMLSLLKHCSKVVTDSGGLQKEAYFFKKPCATLRRSTEWTETLEGGWNVLLEPDPETLCDFALNHTPRTGWLPLYGDGRASAKIVDCIAGFL